MDKLIDVTHTVKASEAPSEGARYMFNPRANVRFWVENAPEPLDIRFQLEQTDPPASNPEVPPRGTMVKMPVQPNPEVPPVPMPTKGRKKRGA